ncbi:MAG TPA: ABC transporter ATP-binding protein [Thermotogota bacterium]|nr:ABC transporter ATP-binding protein [Thermotogota bacterium]
MIQVKDLSFAYDIRTKPVLSNISLEINRGEFFGIIGPNGAGKTTLFKLLLGFLTPATGTIKILGTVINTMKRKDIAKKISAVMQEFSPAYDFTVEEIVHLGRTPYLNLFSDESKEDCLMVKRAIMEAELEGFEDKLFNRLSGGEKQRVLIAKCFAQNTPIILLDEFAAHLDIGHVQQLIQRVYKKNKEDGITVVGIFHDINIASLYCDRIAVLNDSYLENVGAPSDVINNRLLENVYHADSYIVYHEDNGKPQVLLRK